MLTGTLIVGAGLQLCAGALFARVGVVTLRRPASDEARLALAGFAAWWFGAGAVLGLGGIQTVLGIVGIVDPAIHGTLLLLRALPISAGLLGLAYYLLYLYTGTRRWAPALVGLYVLHFAFTLYYLQSLDPLRVETTAWEIRAGSENPPSAALSAVFGVALALPILTATAGYATLLLRLQDRTQRYRVALVSVAFAQWFLFVLAGFVAQLTAEPWFFLIYTLPGLAAAALVLAAFEPPSYLRARFGVERVARRGPA